MENNFEEDLKKIKTLLKDEKTAKELYGALCNMRWINLKDSSQVYSCSWRYAGGIVAGLRGMGESYLDFYCSGSEGHVTPLIESLLLGIGWGPFPYDDIE